MKITFNEATRKTLRRYDVSEDVFDDLLQNLATKIVIVDNIKDYFKGYKQKHFVIYDNKEYLICREHLVAYFANFSTEDYQGIEDWRQVIVRKVVNQSNSYTRSIDGSRAWKYEKQLICDAGYTEQEFEECLRMFEAEYDKNQIQFHYQYPSSSDVVLAHRNAVKYDINGAHQAALIKIFPKAEKVLREQFAKRKEEPIIKSYINYFVGMLKRKGFAKTYNWIVQSVSKQLKEAIVEVSGNLIYANTDGFMVSDPEHKLKASKELGKFKLEFEGTAYTYNDKNYWFMQCGDEIKGSIRYQVRDQVDLRQGKVVHYDLKRYTNENGVIVHSVENTQMEIVNVYEEN